MKLIALSLLFKFLFNLLVTFIHHFIIIIQHIIKDVKKQLQLYKDSLFLFDQKRLQCRNLFNYSNSINFEHLLTQKRLLFPLANFTNALIIVCQSQKIYRLTIQIYNLYIETVFIFKSIASIYSNALHITSLTIITQSHCN